MRYATGLSTNDAHAKVNEQLAKVPLVLLLLLLLLSLRCLFHSSDTQRHDKTTRAQVRVRSHVGCLLGSRGCHDHDHTPRLWPTEIARMPPIFNK